MKNCLNENDVAEYVDWLLNGLEQPDEKLMNQVQHCQHCKQEIMETCDLMVHVGSGLE